MSKLTLKIINIFFILFSIGLLIWLINQNIPYYGNQIIKLDFTKDQPMVSRLGPEVRTKIVDGYLAVLESPVYFDLRSLPWFRTARIYFTFKNDGAQLEGVAPQVGPGWQYHLVEPLVTMDLEDDLPANEAGWQKAVFDFKLDTVYQNKNVRRFLISTNHEDQGKLLVKDLTIILER